MLALAPKGGELAARAEGAVQPHDALRAEERCPDREVEPTAGNEGSPANTIGGAVGFVALLSRAKPSFLWPDAVLVAGAESMPALSSQMTPYSCLTLIQGGIVYLRREINGITTRAAQPANGLELSSRTIRRQQPPPATFPKSVCGPMFGARTGLAMP